jgi:hypothetical protein
MDEHIVAAFVALDEAEALSSVEELDLALPGANDLRGHSPAAAAATARPAVTAETTTAAEAAAPRPAIAEAPTVTAAKTVTASESTFHEGIETVFADAIPLVAALAATSSVETHVP